MFVRSGQAGVPMWAYAHDAGRLAIATTLLIAGASKLVSPRPSAASLAQVFGLTRPVAVLVTRLVATVELAAAFLVAGGWLGVVGPVLTALVGAGICGYTTTAIRRGATAPCGCFGLSSGRPPGARNAIAGTGLLAGAGVLLATPAGTAAALMLSLTALVAVAAVLVRDRARLVPPFRRHFRPAPGAVLRAGSEVS